MFLMLVHQRNGSELCSASKKGSGFFNFWSFVMASKRTADVSDVNASKKRKTITMEKQFDIRRSKNCQTPTNIGRSFNLSYSTVATILKDRERKYH